MKFEIDVEIPNGFEPTGEYRYPRSREWFLAPLDSHARNLLDTRGCGRRVILREKPLAYEDFEERCGVRCRSGSSFPIRFASDRVTSDRAREVAAALVAAADHVDRVNQQNNAA